ncbi:MAG: FecCD family ABC transporter permease [Tissierella sp.]|uniref:FecCD family ABC transporter permease n=1 Tax=Tissierella sp. TaxID=41274 RepID=UPI003F95DB98
MNNNSRNKIFTYSHIKLFALISILVFVFSFVIGRYSVSIKILLRVFSSKFIDIPLTWPKSIETVIFKIRFPRILAALLVGASLSVSGLVYQGIFKNPLASPDILGVSSGAAFGASLAILLSYSSSGIQLTSFIFGLLAVGLVYFISCKINQDPLVSLVITGVLIGSIFSSLTSLIKYLADTNDKLPTITFWLMGSLSDISIGDIKTIIFPIMIGIIPLFILRWRLNVLTLDEDEAKTLGIDTKKMKLIVIICSTLITASAVSISGMVGWIGLVIPHLSRAIVGPNYMELIPSTILLGASYLLIIDNISRTIASVEIPLGILTSLIGAPLFIFLLMHRKRRIR